MEKLVALKVLMDGSGPLNGTLFSGSSSGLPIRPHCGCIPVAVATGRLPWGYALGALWRQ